MTNLVLGLYAGANSAAAIGSAGRLLYCVQEERLTGIKGYMGFPTQAVTACLDRLGAKPEDITHVAYGSRSGSTEHCPREEFLRRLAAFHVRPDRAEQEMALLADESPAVQNRIRAHLADVGITAPVTFTDHHLTHAATAYYGLRANPRSRYLVLTCDGFGDGACATVSLWQNGQHREIARTDLRNSVGLLYFWTTHAYGFTPHEDEYKLMGMAPYANPERAAAVAAIYARYLTLDASGLRFVRNTGVSLEQSWPAIRRQLHRHRFDDVFAGLQRFTEDLMCAWTAAAITHTSISDVLASGGVFMNVKANGRIAALPEVRTFAAFPSCGDESLPIGAFYLTSRNVGGHDVVEPLGDCYLGDDVTDAQATAALSGIKWNVRRPSDIDGTVADLLASGEIVGRCAGPMEFGARALGNRSILADPGNADLPRVLNRLVKQRDFWMPFAPAILASRQHDYLDNPKRIDSPYMMMAFPAQPAAVPEMIAALHPADLTCRPQIVPDDADTGLARILTAYQRRTGRAALLNTSLNLHGHPIVRTAGEALAVLDRSELRHMQVGPYLVSKDAPDVRP
ncbi:carbamoyltransferase C-terminal domain-containing protein [Plantactinospora sp. WMMB334]|uniref:carbamoyltransferase C-terminal domain-containing protein n=1 Tax=Plantactinospora sp. WMMB334 TaxID=3404119 RepID=UPI003B963132